jgi:catechol 2,3-dioxygenase-like lactoylglutathione lyase family enzyme
MARVQLALNVTDLDEAIGFYSKLFGTEPTKVRPGYANFAVTDPPLKLVLIEDASSVPGSLNHLGIEVESTTDVTTARERLAAADLEAGVLGQVACCFALQDKIWVNGPGGEPWEIYTVLGDSDVGVGESPVAAPGGGACCSVPPEAAVASGSPCCS